MQANDKSGLGDGQSHGSCLTQAGARRLARQIENFWTSRGHAVAVTVEHGIDGVWGVRSNLVGGLPIAPGGQS